MAEIYVLLDENAKDLVLFNEETRDSWDKLVATGHGNEMIDLFIETMNGGDDSQPFDLLAFSDFVRHESDFYLEALGENPDEFWSQEMPNPPIEDPDFQNRTLLVIDEFDSKQLPFKGAVKWKADRINELGKMDNVLSDYFGGLEEGTHNDPLDFNQFCEYIAVDEEFIDPKPEITQKEMYGFDGPVADVVVIEPGKLPQYKCIPSKLDELEKLVGGDIDSVLDPAFDEKTEGRVAILVDKDAKKKGRPANRTIWEDNEVSDVICGSMILVSTEQAPRDDFELNSIPFDLAEICVDFYKNPEIIQVNEKGEVEVDPVDYEFDVDDPNIGLADSIRESADKISQIPPVGDEKDDPDLS